MRENIVDVRAIAAKFPSQSTAFARPTPVERGTFEGELLRATQPTLLGGLAKSWPAYQRWTFDFLATAGTGIPVVATKSIVETAKTRRVTLDMGDYIRSVLAGDEAVAGGQNQTYVSFLPLFEVLPKLKADVPFGELFLPRTICDPHAWIGPAGTITGLHCDNFPNLLIQLRGRKGLLLFPPSPLNRLYQSSKSDFGATLSLVDLRAPDWQRFPRLRELTPVVVILHEGDAIYIPPGWWHYVVSETPSVTLSIFAGRVRHMLRGVGPQLFHFLLHQAGLYARGNCVCHNPA